MRAACCSFMLCTAAAAGSASRCGLATAAGSASGCGRGAARWCWRWSGPPALQGPRCRMGAVDSTEGQDVGCLSERVGLVPSAFARTCPAMSCAPRHSASSQWTFVCAAGAVSGDLRSRSYGTSYSKRLCLRNRLYEIGRQNRPQFLRQNKKSRRAARRAVIS